MQYTDPEHSEIINNLPPEFLIASQGDFLNQNTIKFHKALKRNGKTSKIIYYGMKDLGHAFVTMHTDCPESIEAIDKMASWFVIQANLANQEKENKGMAAKKKKEIETRTSDHRIADQKAWKFIKELNSVSSERLETIALASGNRSYAYRQIFRKWDHYAEVFSAIGLTGKDHSRVG